MTLCVAVIDENENIHMLSDSTATMNGYHSEIAVKVLPARVRIFDPQETNASGDPTVLPTYFDKNYGICFSGSFTGMQILKSYLDIALASIQRWPFYNVSFSDICSYVQNFYDEVCQRLVDELHVDLTVDFFFSGLCPTAKVVKLAQFSIIQNKEDGFETRWHVLPPQPSIYEIGSGDKAFRDVLDSTFCSSLLSAAHTSLGSIINDPSTKSVGGNIQYGRFDGHGDFETLGRISGHRYYIGGVDINSRPHSERNNLITRYSFIES